MLQLENYRIDNSDRLNWRIEQFKDVKVKDSDKTVKKWVKLPEYHGSLEKALRVLLNGDMLNNLLAEEAMDIKALLDKVDETYNRLIKE